MYVCVCIRTRNSVLNATLNLNPSKQRANDLRGEHNEITTNSQHNMSNAKTKG